MKSFSAHRSDTTMPNLFKGAFIQSSETHQKISALAPKLFTGSTCASGGMAPLAPIDAVRATYTRITTAPLLHLVDALLHEDGGAPRLPRTDPIVLVSTSTHVRRVALARRGVSCAPLIGVSCTSRAPLPTMPREPLVAVVHAPDAGLAAGDGEGVGRDGWERRGGAEPAAHRLGGCPGAVSSRLPAAARLACRGDATLESVEL